LHTKKKAVKEETRLRAQVELRLPRPPSCKVQQLQSFLEMPDQQPLLQELLCDEQHRILGCQQTFQQALVRLQRLRRHSMLKFSEMYSNRLEPWAA
jgi:hypothetical protein